MATRNWASETGASSPMRSWLGFIGPLVMIGKESVSGSRPGSTPSEDAFGALAPLPAFPRTPMIIRPSLPDRLRALFGASAPPMMAEDVPNERN
jgi:hypothetical protein